MDVILEAINHWKAEIQRLERLEADRMFIDRFVVLDNNTKQIRRTALDKKHGKPTT